MDEMLNKYISEQNGVGFCCLGFFFLFNEKLNILKENIFLTKSMYKIFFPQAETIQQECLLKYEQR